MNAFEMFGLLLAGHALADYPLQGDFLAKAKNHKNPIPGVPYWQALWAHSAIHAGVVGIITGSFVLAVMELICHYVIDYVKCDGSLTYNQDQALHVFCKYAYVMLLFVAGSVTL